MAKPNKSPWRKFNTEWVGVKVKKSKKKMEGFEAEAAKPRRKPHNAT